MTVVILTVQFLNMFHEVPSTLALASYTSKLHAENLVPDLVNCILMALYSRRKTTLIYAHTCITFLLVSLLTV